MFDRQIESVSFCDDSSTETSLHIKEVDNLNNIIKLIRRNNRETPSSDSFRFKVVAAMQLLERKRVLYHPDGLQSQND